MLVRKRWCPEVCQEDQEDVTLVLADQVAAEGVERNSRAGGEGCGRRVDNMARSECDVWWIRLLCARLQHQRPRNKIAFGGVIRSSSASILSCAPSFLAPSFSLLFLATIPSMAIPPLANYSPLVSANRVPPDKFPDKPSHRSFRDALQSSLGPSLGPSSPGAAKKSLIDVGDRGFGEPRMKKVEFIHLVGMEAFEHNGNTVGIGKKIPLDLLKEKQGVNNLPVKNKKRRNKNKPQTRVDPELSSTSVKDKSVENGDVDEDIPVTISNQFQALASSSLPQEAAPPVIIPSESDGSSFPIDTSVVSSSSIDLEEGSAPPRPVPLFRRISHISPLAPMEVPLIPPDSLEFSVPKTADNSQAIDFEDALVRKNHRRSKSLDGAELILPKTGNKLGRKMSDLPAQKLATRLILTSSASSKRYHD
ncbi:hypothetical protein BUALT_Bualt03G0231400 [Buddleja alternifolia]|uniref:Uncharacterized protein n=1 Tax=Buddleja alternifolia TaxID=168488 RepID=A0AAV6XXS4_9LAMI|nr:hypothetical protein BUALT_Bualt03G0231400 [Buddleja alternifolia]